MKRIAIETATEPQTVPFLGTANNDLAHARIYSAMDANELIKKDRMRAALEQLREGQWPDPETKLLELVAKLLSDYALFRHWLHPEQPDGSWTQIEVPAIDPALWNGPN